MRRTAPDIKAFFLAVPAAIWQVCFLYIPLMFVLSAAFFIGWQRFDWQHLSLDNFDIVSSSVHLMVIVTSLLRALFVATMCLLIGYPVSYLFALKMKRYKTVFLFLLMLPFWTNFLVHVYAWFFVLERNGLINKLLMCLGIIHEPLKMLYTSGAVNLVLIYSYLPFMMLPLFSALEKFDYTLIEASLDLGATPKNTFFNITMPLTMGGIRNGFFLVFVPVFGEYAIPALLGGGKTLTVGGLISAYYLEARDPALGAAFTVLSSVIVLGVVWLLYHALSGPRIPHHVE
jgi:spermidine/putrescine transport system permease protein